MLFATFMAVIVGIYHDLIQVNRGNATTLTLIYAYARFHKGQAFLCISEPKHPALQDRVAWLPHLADYEGLSTVFDILSFALALLLVFRTNACYGR